MLRPIFSLAAEVEAKYNLALKFFPELQRPICAIRGKWPLQSFLIFTSKKSQQEGHLVVIFLGSPSHLLKQLT